jgi:hypothetical protein
MKRREGMTRGCLSGLQRELGVPRGGNGAFGGQTCGAVGGFGRVVGRFGGRG